MVLAQEPVACAIVGEDGGFRFLHQQGEDECEFSHRAATVMGQARDRVLAVLAVALVGAGVLALDLVVSSLPLYPPGCRHPKLA